MPPPVSIIILTLNEETNIADCLASVAEFDDVHVLDSGSSDQTVAIATKSGASVHHHAFQGFGQQRNWAIENIPTKYEWQFHLDADERMTPALVKELLQTVTANPPHGGFHVSSKLMFAGQWLRYAGQYPAYQLRLLHKDRLQFVDYGHGQREKTDLPVGVLKEPTIHLALSKGLDDWFSKHIGYARREAEQALAGEPDAAGGRLFSADATQRRRALKRLAARLPARYLLRLGYLLFWRGALLDGWAGITYAHMLASYEGMVDVYLRLLKRGIDPDRCAPRS
jgi:glycosyltransferase involved in cell wall biosynthesis